MKKALFGLFTKNFSSVLCEILGIVKQFLILKTKKVDEKQKKAEEDKKFRDKIEEVVNNGSLSDLKSLKKY